MTELERRALLGDERAQQECTRQGIVLPCPLCAGKLEELITGNIFKCHKCGCVFKFPLNGKDFGLYELLEKINTRQAPPIGRCRDCKNSPDIGTKTKGMRWCRRFRAEVKQDGYCEGFKPKEREENR